MSDGYAPGQRVRIASEAIGTVTLAGLDAFTEYIAKRGERGTVYTEQGAMPEGWLLVRLDDDHGYEGGLFAPVHPTMIEPAGPDDGEQAASDGGDDGDDR